MLAQKAVAIGIVFVLAGKAVALGVVFVFAGKAVLLCLQEGLSL